MAVGAQNLYNIFSLPREFRALPHFSLPTVTLWSMNLSLKGKFFKTEQTWVAQIPPLGIEAKGATSIACLKNLIHHIKTQLDDPSIDLAIKVEDDGIFYFMASNKASFMNFIACQVAKHDPYTDFEEIEKWLMVVEKE